MMRRLYLRLGLLSIALMIAIAPAAAQRITRGDPLSEPLGAPESPADPAYLRGVAADQGSVRVIVSLQTQQPGRMAFETMSEQSQQAMIAQMQNALLAELGLTRSATGVKRYTAFPALALQLNSAQLAIMQQSSLVTHIREDRWRAPSLFEGTTNIGMRGSGGAWAAGAEGVGQVVVIIDSGVSNTHPYLAGKVVSEACFSSNASAAGFTVSSLCPAGVTSSTAPGSAAPCVLLDPAANAAGSCHHGTHIADIIAGRDTVNPGNPFDGVARKANLISVQVFSRIVDDSDPNTPAVCNRTGYPYNECILASDSDILAGLDFAYGLRTQYEIAAVNMSFGNESWSSQSACDAAYPDYKARIDLFRAAEIAVVSSSGNQGSISAMNAPACITGVISVGASCDGGPAGCTVNTIAPLTNAAPFLTFLAPGISIDAATPDTIGHSVKSGTSQSAAFVSGAYAALRSYSPGATIDQITAALTQSAIPIDDYATPLIEMYPKIQVNAALPLLIVPDKPILLAPANNAAFAESPITFTWTQGDHTDTYRLQIYNESMTKLLKEVRVKPDECTTVDPVEGQVCSVDVTYAFRDDKLYRWRVNARNKSNGSATDSEWRIFQFDTPGAALLLTPARGVTINTPEELAVFQWSEVSLATSYRVTLYDTANGAVKITTPELPEASVCAAQICAYTPTPADYAALRDDKKYKWYVTSISADGTSQSAEWVIKAEFPAAPLLMSPADAYVFRALDEIQLVWTEVAAADDYQIQIVDTASGKTIITETLGPSSPTMTCASGACTFVPSIAQRAKFKNKALYRWTVAASNTLGSNTSAARTFKTKFPAPPVLISPVAPTTLDNPAITFVFTQISDADSYELFIKRMPQKNVVLQRGLTPAGNLACDGNQCVYTLNASDQSKLVNGTTYLWYVKSVNAAGKAASATREFTLQSPRRAALFAPAAGANLHARADATFTWEDVGPGVTYELRLKDRVSGKLAVSANITGAACSGGTCTYTLDAGQQAKLRDEREYKWWVISANGFGRSASLKRKFTTLFPRTPLPLTPADKHVLNAPAALVNLQWQSGGTISAVTYRLRVRRIDNSQLILDQSFVNSVGLVCDPFYCIYTVPLALQNDLRNGRNYEWWVVTTSADGSKTGPKFILKARFS